MPLSTWVSLANTEGYSQINTGVALSSSTSLTDISPGANTAGRAYTILGSSLYLGSQVRVSARGVFSTSGTPNLTLGVYYGGVAGTALATALFAASANVTNGVWSMTADIRCEATGTSGTLRTLGAVSGIANAGPTMLPQTAGGGATATVDTSQSSILTVGAQWGTNSASNSIQVLEFLVEALN